MDRVLEVDVVLVNFVLGSLVPLLVAFGSKLGASSPLKAVLNVIGTIVVGTGGYLLTVDGETTVLGLATAVIAAYLASGVSYQNLWKPTGVAPALQRKTAGFGLGKTQASYT